MLVLSRKTGESVSIDGGIEVKVLDIRDGRVRLGFSAPSDVNIQRNEIRRPCSAPCPVRGEVEALCAGV
jgi:carbon storage regulator CsrA